MCVCAHSYTFPVLLARDARFMLHHDGVPSKGNRKNNTEKENVKEMKFYDVSMYVRPLYTRALNPKVINKLYVLNQRNQSSVQDTNLSMVKQIHYLSHARNITTKQYLIIPIPSSVEFLELNE